MSERTIHVESYTSNVSDTVRAAAEEYRRYGDSEEQIQVLLLAVVRCAYRESGKGLVWTVVK